MRARTPPKRGCLLACSPLGSDKFLRAPGDTYKFLGSHEPNLASSPLLGSSGSSFLCLLTGGGQIF